MMRRLIITVAFASAAIATPAAAQEAEPAEFTGFYFGGSIGATSEPDNDDERILFDRNLDGGFGDTVTTSFGANLFSPGFCGGSVGTSTTLPTDGCDEGGTELEFSSRIGFDFQSGPLVFGVVGEVGTTDYRSSTTAFSAAPTSAPASFTFTREVDYLADLRGRIGFTATPMSLVYVTAGVSMAKLQNSFGTTNAGNSVNLGDLDDENIGYVVGLGFEQKVNRNFSVGLEYLYREFEDDSTVRLGGNGTTLITNPFLLGNSTGTDFARSQAEFDLHSLRAVVNFRF
jgi:outer membrane immunogenic protein